MSDSEEKFLSQRNKHLPSTQPLRHRSWGFPRREKPQFLHIIMGAGVAILSYYLLLQCFRPFLEETMTELLSLSRIADLSLTLTWQRSGLFSIIIFGLLFVSLAFPLKGPLWLKIAWLEFGSFVGLAWSFIRLFTVALVAYYFGAGAFALAEFITSPMFDFLWVIPVWSLGLSLVVSAKRKTLHKKEGEFGW